MILKYKKFESIRRQPLEGIVITKSQISEFDIPESIIKEMLKWDVIFKSPYSNSFYSSIKIKRGFKPDGVYRVSDHWNYISKYDGEIHSQTYGTVIESKGDKKIISLGIYNESDNKYQILISEKSPKFKEMVESNKKRISKLKDPKKLMLKKKFKDQVSSGKIHTKFTFDGEEYSGILKKYTGSSIKIESESGELVFLDNHLKGSKIQKMVTSDIHGCPISNPIYDDFMEQC